MLSKNILSSRYSLKLNVMLRTQLSSHNEQNSSWQLFRGRENKNDALPLVSTLRLIGDREENPIFFLKFQIWNDIGFTAVRCTRWKFCSGIRIPDPRSYFQYQFGVGSCDSGYHFSSSRSSELTVSVALTEPCSPVPYSAEVKLPANFPFLVPIT